MFRLKVENVATPLAAATVLVPASVPFAGLVPIATVILVVAVVTVLPWASWTATCTAGVLAAPATALLGCTMKASFVAVGWTGPEVLPEHPPSATPHNTTPTQNPPRDNTPLRRLIYVLPPSPVLALIGEAVWSVRSVMHGSAVTWGVAQRRRLVRG